MAPECYVASVVDKILHPVVLASGEHVVSEGQGFHKENQHNNSQGTGRAMSCDQKDLSCS